MASQNVIDLILRIRNEGGQNVQQFSGQLQQLTNSVQNVQNSVQGAQSGLQNYNQQAQTTSQTQGQLNTSTSDLGGSMRRLVGPLLAVGAAMVGLSSTADRIREIRELAVASDRLGTSMEELTAAQYAAFQGGNVGPEEFSSALDDLNERIIDFARNGAGEAVDVMERFNLDVQELASMNAVDQFTTIADALKGISGNERAQILDQLGSDGLRALAPMLKDGSDEFERLMQEAKDAGIAISSIDAANIEKLGKNLDKTSSRIKAGFTRILATLSPAIDSILTGINNLISRTGEWSPTFQKVGSVVLKTIGFLSNSLRGIQLIFIGLKGGAQAFAGVIVSSFSTAGDLVAALWNSVAENVRGLLENMLTAMGRVSATARELANSIKQQDWSISTEGAKKASEDLFAAARETRKQWEKLAGEPLPETKFNEWLAKLKKEQEQFKKEVDQKVADKESEREDVNYGDRDSQAVLDARRTLSEAISRMEKEAQQRIQDARISAIQHEKDLAIAALDERADKEGADVAAIARERINLEQEASRQIGDSRAAIIQADLDALAQQKAQLVEMRDVSAESEEERITLTAEIRDLEAEIAAKVAEQGALKDEVARKNQLIEISLKHQAALELERQRTAEEREAKQLSDKQQREAEQRAKEQKRLDEEVLRAKLSLMRIEGNEAEANIIAIENDNGELLSKLAAGSEEAAIVEKLIDRSKAKVLMEELENDLNDLTRRFERGDISRDEYRDGVDAIAPEIREQAGETGNDGNLEEVNNQLEDAYKRVDMIGQISDMVGQKITDGLVSGLEGLINGTKTAGEAFREMAAGILSEIARMIIQQQILNAVQGAMGGLGGGGGIGGAIASVFHGGGIAGSGSRKRWVDPSIFAFAPRYHTGGIAGLAPNEVPAILEKGERVMTEAEQKEMARNQGQGGNSATNVTVNNMIDSQSVAAAMDGSEGENTVMNHIKANASEIKALFSQ